MSWPMVMLKELAAPEPYSCVGGPFGSNLTSRDYVSEGVPVIRGSNLDNGRYLGMTDFVFVSEQKVREDLSSNLAKPLDLIFTQRGTLGQVAIVPEVGISDRYVVSQSQMKVTVDETKADRVFLYYYFSSNRTIQKILSFISSSGVPHINLTVLRNFEVPHPPVPVQKRIASILSAYDDLIENNRRRIQLLEQAALLLYKEWFVHLRFPGHERTTTTHGLPTGWVRKPLSEIAEFRLGKMLDQKRNRGDPKPYLANVNVRWGGFDFDGLREMRFEPHEIDKYGLRYGDIVMCEGGEPGRCAIWREQVPGMMIQKALHRIRPKKDIDHRFLYHSLSYRGRSGRLAMLFTGATIKHLPREKLAKVAVEIPSARLMNLFVEQVQPIEDQIGVLQTGISRAAQGRDLLLSRLMNGEVTV